MKRFTETTELAFSDQRDSRAVIVTGSVTLHSFDGDSWIEGDTLTAGTYEVFTKGFQIKFELVSGASFSVDMGLSR